MKILLSLFKNDPDSAQVSDKNDLYLSICLSIYRQFSAFYLYLLIYLKFSPLICSTLSFFHGVFDQKIN